MITASTRKSSVATATNQERISDNFPPDLIDRPQWVAWSNNKVPLNPRTGEAADSTDPKTWGTFDEACKLVDSDPRAIGIGYVFAKDDPYFGIDLDGAVDGGTVSALAEEVLKAMPLAYAELSPSGKGLHVIAAGRLPTERGGINSKKVHGVEIYHHSRYFTVTGDVFRGRKCDLFVPDYQEQAALFWHAWQGRGDRGSSGKLLDHKTRIELCWKAVENLPDAIQGEKGSDKFFRAVCEMWRWGLRDEDVLALARRYSREKSNPPWPEDQIRHKINDTRDEVMGAGELACRILALRGLEKLDAAHSCTETWTEPLDREVARLRRREPWKLYDCGFSEIMLMPGEITSFVAGPGVGKTTFALQLLANALERHPETSCLFGECEMSATALANRLLGMWSGVDAEKVQFRADQLTDADLERIDDASQQLTGIASRINSVKLPLSLTRMMQAFDQTRPQLVCLDYVQRIRDPQAKDAREAVTLAMEAARTMASKGAAVIVISSANRDNGYDSMALTSFRDSSEAEYGSGFAYGLTTSPQRDQLTIRQLKSRFGLFQPEVTLTRDSALYVQRVPCVDGYTERCINAGA